MTTVEFFKLLLDEISIDSLIEKHPFLTEDEIRSHFDCVFKRCENDAKDNALYELYTDGASKGNPGHAGIGFVIKKDGYTIQEQSKYIGITTNNVAEYTALLEGLKRIKTLGINKVKVFSDSELMVKQINGDYSIKNNVLQKLYNQVMSITKGLKSFSVEHIPRSQNIEADRLSKKGSMDHST